jgi:hypothetical protein
MFRFTGKPSSGSHSQYLDEITHLVQCGYMEVVQTLSVLWMHSITCEACVKYTAHTPHRSYCVVCISWTIKCLPCSCYLCYIQRDNGRQAGITKLRIYFCNAPNMQFILRLFFVPRFHPCEIMLEFRV